MSDPSPTKPTISSLDSPSSYLHASKQDKKAIKAAYSEIFKIPKKKRKSQADESEEGKSCEESAAEDKGRGDSSGGPLKKRRARSASPAKASPGKSPGGATGVDDKPSKKRGTPKRGKAAAAPEAEHARLTSPPKVNESPPTKTNDDEPDSILRKGDLVRLDSSNVNSGRIQGGLARVTKIYTREDETDKSEYCYDIEYVLGGKVTNIPRGELIYTTAEAEGLVSTNLRERRSNRSAKEEEEEQDTPAKCKKDFASRRSISRDGSVSSRNSKKAPAKKAATKAQPKRNSRRTSTDDDSSDANPINDSRALDMYTRHKRELERSLGRLEKVDRFGFFFDKCPPDMDEHYDNGEDVTFPDGPPFNFVVLKKRFDAGRYDLDFVKAEVERRNEIKSMLRKQPIETVKEETDVAEADGAESNNADEEALLYDEVAATMSHPIGVDWDTFNSDVHGMCDAAIERNPEDGNDLSSGHLGNSANKIKKLMDEMYTNYGCKRRAEMEGSGARLKYETILNNCGNREAAMQGKWRKQAFPERKYERLETSSVICDGLSELDKSYAIYELGTSIPDSFVGLAYTYDDSGQHSENWMKTVVDETTAKPKSRRKKKGADDSSDAEKNKNKEQSAAALLAKDDAVAKAQVQNTMQSLLIQVQDKVMTDLGVMNQPEARSANWDDGDDRRNYRGGAAEVEQGSKLSTLPEVAEQEVWGVDCYTRKNVMALIEAEFSAEIALEFMEKWLLPAINACPVDLAHDISTAARILEGLPIDAVDFGEKEAPKTDHSMSTSEIKTDEAPEPSPEDKQVKIPETIESQPSSPRRKAPESSVFLRNALESKIKSYGPPWLKAAARLIRLAADSLDEDDGFFRIHPKGHGSVVIAENGLKANSLVTYYRGEVYPAWRWCEKMDAIEKTQKDLNLRPNLPDFYNMAMERPKKDPRGYGILFVDASRKSGLGSSFSHSCNPSCEVRVVALNGKLSLAMTTIRDLEQGEELTFDYNAVTESVTEYRFAICLCGHNKCRGSFLHFASAPCYQQVLSRNCPMASRFANLVRGCMKQVMSREDSEILLRHGFKTAAFGAVSFNHQNVLPTSAAIMKKLGKIKDESEQLGQLLLELSSSPPSTGVSSSAVEKVSSSGNAKPDSSDDSIENVPIWLRTYVADTLRYIEYERRALPVALLCNQMERIEQQKAQLKKEKQRKVAPVVALDLSKPEKSKSVSGSKPTSSYFFYLSTNREEFQSIVKNEPSDKELKGLALSQAVNKYGAQAWSKLSDEEKQSWKDRAISDWKQSGGQGRAKLDEERAKNMDIDEDISPGTADVVVEQKEISFADAEAEGLSAMEQRIQQLAQSLSRVGRVLDRHRESKFRKMKGTKVNSAFLRSLVPSPLKIMSDEEVVNWTWNDKNGVVHNLFAMIDQHFPKKSLLRKLLSNTRATYPVLTCFLSYSDSTYHPSVEPRKGKSACSSEDARGVLREALLEFRSDINDFLSFAEKSHFDAIRKKKNDAANRRKAEREAKATDYSVEVNNQAEDTVCSDLIPEDSQHVSEVQEDSSVANSNVSEDVMRIRGGGENSLCSDSNPPVDVTTSDNNGTLLHHRGLPEPMAATMPESASNLQSQSVAAPAVGLSAPEQIHDSEGATCNGSLPELDTKPDIITPSSTQTQAKNDEQTASLLSLPLPNETMEQQGAVANIEKSAVEGRSEQETSAMDALALMANLAAAAPLADEQQVGQASDPNALLELPPEVLHTIQSSQQVPAPIRSSLAMPTEFTQSLADEVASPTPEPKKKKVVKMTDAQVAYLKNWLVDPIHILNPYPSEEEKTKIMNELGVEQYHLERWLSRHRKPVILSPDKEPVKMKWDDADSNHWAEFRRQRYMLEATADLLLMYACTNTFFLLEPFNRFDSTPIEVYARELGNDVPRHFASANRPTPSSPNRDVQPSTSSTEPKELLNEGPQTEEQFCSPEDVITSVTVSYSGEYVISQLLQWFNGGIGQPQGLPDVFGCVMLPPVSGCWDDVKDCGETKVGTYTRATDYETKARLRLADWIDDRTKRGSPWNEDFARYFCKAGASPDPSMPMGSPVIDYLVTGIEDNIQYVSSALRNKDGKGMDSPARSRSKASASDRLQSTVDAGMPAQAVANWVQCENPNCLKWRKLPWHVDIDLLPEQFFCKDNIWTTGRRNCEVPEDKWDMSDAPVKFDTVEEDFAVGVWFDVQRDGKVGYHEAQVVEIDFNSAVKRVKFHFWRLSNASDEWVEVGSPRIAPHHTYTPRPVDGYGISKKDKKKNKAKAAAAKADDDDAKKRKSNEIEALEKAGSPKKIKPTPVYTSTSEVTNKKAAFPKAIVAYLNNWFEQHIDNPFPTQQQKLIMMASTGLNKRQLSDWLSKARKKQKQQTDGDKAAVKVDADSEKLENLLLQLKGGVPVVAKTPITGNPVVQSVTPKMIPGTKTGTPSREASKDLKSPSPNNVGLSEGVKRYLQKWISDHKLNPFPTKEEKDTMIKDLGLAEDDLRKLEGWFSRTRKKMKDDLRAQLRPTDRSALDKISAADVDKYLNTWLQKPENAANFNPTLDQRAKMEKESGIESRRIESWFYRFRKKMKKQQEQPEGNGVSTQQVAASTSATNPQTDVLAPNPSNRVSQVAATSNPTSSNSAPNQANASKPVQSSSNASSNLDLLFEAASIHSAAKEAAKEAYSKMEREVRASHAQNNPYYNSAPQVNQSFQRPPPEPAARFSGSQMRFSPIFCQPVHNRSDGVSRGPTPPNNQNQHPIYNDHHPSTGGFVPIRPDGFSNQQHSRGPTPTYHNAHPSYPSNGPIRMGDQYQRSSPYMNMSHQQQQQQIRYPRPNEQHPYHPGNGGMENAQYYQHYQSRYNMHNGQQNGSQHQR